MNLLAIIEVRHLQSDLGRWAVVTGAFVASVAIVGLIGWWGARRRERGARRLAAATGQPLHETDSSLFQDLAPALAAQLPESRKERREFQKLLHGAGFYSPNAATTFYALRFILLAAPLLVAGVFCVLLDSRYTLITLCAGGLSAAVLGMLPRLYVFFRRRRRMKAIRRGLPDTIDMLSMCVGSGLSLGNSVDYVTRQLSSYPDLATELTILKRQSEMSTLELALAELTARVQLPEIRQFASLLTRGDRLGAKLAPSLLSQADHLRTARKQAAMQQANKTPVKLVLPLMFCFAPAALILLTAPAVIELKEFLAPSHGQSVLSGDAGQLFAPSRVIDTLDQLGQGFDD